MLIDDELERIRRGERPAAAPAAHDQDASHCSEGVLRYLWKATPAQISSTTPNGQVLLWDAVTGKRLRALGVEGPALNCLAFSHDGRRLALGAAGSSTINPRLRVVDARTGGEVFSRLGHRSKASAPRRPRGRMSGLPLGPLGMVEARGRR